MFCCSGNNKISGSIPSEFGNLRSLDYLSLCEFDVVVCLILDVFGCYYTFYKIRLILLLLLSFRHCYSW